MTEESVLSDQAAFLVALAERNIPPDVQELLVQGDPMRGIAPGALSAAIRAIQGPIRPPPIHFPDLAGTCSCGLERNQTCSRHPCERRRVYAVRPPLGPSAAEA